MNKLKLENSWLGNMSLLGKVSLVIAFPLFLFALSTLGIASVQNKEQQIRRAAVHTSDQMRQITRATRYLYERQYEIRQILFATTRADIKAFNATNEAFERTLAELTRSRNTDAVQQSRLDRLQDLNRGWMAQVADPILKTMQQAWARSENAPLDERERVFASITARTTVATSDLIAILDQLADRARADRIEQDLALAKMERQPRLFIYSSFVVALLCGATALFLLAMLITRPLRHLSGLMTRLAAQDLDIDIPQLGRRDEVGTIARALLEFKKMAIETSDQNWIKTGVAAVSERLQKVETHRDFADSLVSEIAPLLNVGVGVFYFHEAEQERLELMGSYGFKALDQLQTSYRLGEGLVGQCGAERKPIFVQDIPANYLQIHSGVGQATPHFLVLLPVVSKGKLLAVVELATFTLLDSRQHLLLAALNSLVALSLENITRAVRTRELLEYTQSQASDLRASEEELRAQQEEMQASNEELRHKSDTLNQQKGILETLQKETQNKAEALTRANQYKSDFLANMSHELRTPLNSLLILSNDLAENGEGNLSPEQAESARIIHSSGCSLLRLINDILDLSKIEAGKMDLLLEPVDLKRFAFGLKRNFNRLATDKQVDFSIAVDDGLPETIVADSGKLEQVVGNLLSNAFKFTRQGSVRVRIGRPYSDHPGFPAARTIAIEVADTGIGIPEDKLERVFDAFEQVDASTSRQFGGTGLGLAISRQLIKVHHGDIALRSELGQGSTFTILLPETQPAQAGTAGDTGARQDRPPRAPAPRLPAAIMDAARNPVRQAAVYIDDDRAALKAGDTVILVIEDDPAFARILMDLIRRKGYRALAAADGEHGLQLARAYRPTGILLDVMLPSMDGWTVIEHLKSDAGVRHIPVHFISALNGSARGLGLGAVGFLTKPVTSEALAGAFERLLHFSSGNTRRLLVVDADATSRAAVRALVETDAVDVLESSSAEDALSRLAGETVDCIVLDLELPGMSGFDFLENISAAHIDVPIVVYSARELSREESLRIRQHTDSIVIKSVRAPERLLDEVSLFLHSIQRQPGVPSADNGEDLTGRKVLVVDDDMRNIFALSKVLRTHGLQVSMAQDSQKALKLLDANPDIELVLMDVMMPVTDGYETIMEIRKDTRFAELPIISLTAKAMRGDREKSLAAGANDYLTKPVDIPKLLSMMRVWLHRQA